MKFDDLDAAMRVFETGDDLCVPPGIYMAARIDGRSFTRLTKEVHRFTAPFDERFRDLMVETVKHLMNCGFNVLYGYTQSDEISLLFHPQENSFARKTRKLNSILAGEASARFSLCLGDIAAFDCRISQLPSAKKVVDYFRWRQEDANRNALNAHCYWKLRDSGLSVKNATAQLEGMSIADKNALLFREYGVAFDHLPNWQKRGIGVYWEPLEREGFNPVTSRMEAALRKGLKVDLELPTRDEYSDFIDRLVAQQSA